MTLPAFTRVRCGIADKSPACFGTVGIGERDDTPAFADFNARLRIAVLRDFLGPRTNMPIDSIKSIIHSRIKRNIFNASLYVMCFFCFTHCVKNRIIKTIIYKGNGDEKQICCINMDYRAYDGTGVCCNAGGVRGYAWR